MRNRVKCNRVAIRVFKIVDIKSDNFSTFIHISKLVYVVRNGLKIGLFGIYAPCKQHIKNTQKKSNVYRKFNMSYI